MSVRGQTRLAGVAVDAENRQRDDFYPTPPEGIRALLSVERFDGPIWEPACGDGAISRVLIDCGYTVISSDLVDRGYGESRVDFLMEWQSRAPNIVTNAPFKLLDAFMRHAVHLYTGKVALLMRLQCLGGQKRGRFYQATPPARVLVFSRRLPSWRNGEVGIGSSMFDYAWYVWDHAHQGKTTVEWLP
jgi:hypothetical protein